MDPVQACKDILMFTEEYYKTGDAAWAMDAHYAFTDLVGWITRGGFMPNDSLYLKAAAAVSDLRGAV